MKLENPLQNRINELSSAIINFVGSKVYITGFYNENMLLAHLTSFNDNHQSKGIYDKDEFNFFNVVNNALFVIQENGVEQKRIQFKQIYKENLKLNNSSKKEIVVIRKDKFSEHYVLLTEKLISPFNNLNELNQYMDEKYRTETLINVEVL